MSNRNLPSSDANFNLPVDGSKGSPCTICKYGLDPELEKVFAVVTLVRHLPCVIESYDVKFYCALCCEPSVMDCLFTQRNKFSTGLLSYITEMVRVDDCDEGIFQLYVNVTKMVEDVSRGLLLDTIETHISGNVQFEVEDYRAYGLHYRAADALPIHNPWLVWE
jgi:hypothetical protein